MKLTYKIIIPLVAIVAILFYFLSLFILNSESKIIEDAKQRNSQKIVQQFEADQKRRLKEEKSNLEFIAKTIAKVSSKYVYDFDMESIGKVLNDFLEVENIKAIEVYDINTNDIFYAVYKNKNTIVNEKKNFLFDTKILKTIKTNIVWEEENLSLGFVEIYYDDSKIINEFKHSKERLFKELELSNKKLTDDTNRVVYNQIFFMSIIALVLFFTIFFMTYKTVLKPLSKLKSGLDDFFLFLQNKKDFTQKIEIKTNDEFGKMAKSLNENISVSAKLHEEIYELNTNLEDKIEERTKKISSLLDNADQGFLSFSKDLLIEPEYSIECEKIFKKPIENIAIGDLLFPQDEEKKTFFEETLVSLFAEKNSLKIKNILSLLQSEFRINKKAIHVKYKLIENSRYMLILTDITAKKILEKKVEKERDTLKMIVSVVSDIDEFFELIDDYYNFIKKGKAEIQKDKTALNNTTILYRVIHTFKGLFSQKEMKQMVKHLHSFETHLSKLLKDQNNTNENLIELLENTDFKNWLEVEINLIKTILGDDIFDKRGKITVKESAISKIEEELLSLTHKTGLENEYSHIINEIQSLKEKPIYLMFNSYIKLVSQIASVSNKHIYPLEVIVNKDLLVKEHLKPFIKSLVHIFRNCVIHGVESMDERYEKEKDEIGTISCSILNEEDGLHIIIADDGKGIDIKSVEEKAKKLGIDTSTLSKNALLELIFEDKLSTSEKVDTFSGRGVGMSAVKDELMRLNGKVNITTQENVGTTFEFIIPK